MKLIFKSIVVLALLFLFGCKRDVTQRNKKIEPEEKTYSVTIAQPQNAKITVTKKEGNVEIVGDALKAIKENTVLVITAKADSGYKVDNLIIDGTQYATSSKEITLTSNISVSASISKEEKPEPEEKTYSVVITQPQNAKISVIKKEGNVEIVGDALKAIKENTVLVITAKADSGYKVDNIIIDDTPYSGSSKEITLTSNISVSATISEEVIATYSVTITQPQNGKITVTERATGKNLEGSDLDAIKENTSLLISIKADKNWEARSITINGTKYEMTSKIIAITENLRVSGEIVAASDMTSIQVGQIIGQEIDYPIPASGTIGRKGVFIKGRTVKLNPYKIGKYEVTYKLWKEVYDWAVNNGYTFKNKGQKGGGQFGAYDETEHTEDEPVTRVCWGDCIVWCNAYTEMKNNSDEHCVYYKTGGSEVLKDATEKDGYDYAFYNAVSKWWKKGYRLPTEAEWELAARYQYNNDNGAAINYGTASEPIYLTKLDRGSGMSKPIGFEGLTLPSGEDWSTLYKDAVSVAVFRKWFDGTSFVEQDPPIKKTEKVGSKNPNALGLYDMSGNVDEWCWDLFADITIGNATNPQGGTNTTHQRMTKGASYDSHCDNQTTGRRDHNRSTMPSDGTGFRIVCSM